MNPPPVACEPWLTRLLDQHQRQPENLLQILRDVQAQAGWVSPSVMAMLAQALRLPLGQVQATVAFYAFLHDRPMGRTRLLFSDSVTDRMQGADALLARLLSGLSLGLDEVSADGAVSVGRTSCIGMNDQGPAMLVNGLTLTRLTPERIDALCALLKQQVPPSQWPADWFAVADNVQRTGLLLGADWAPGDALKAAVARGRSGMLDELKRSRLRGRGGAGFTTAVKWEAAQQAPGHARYVVCNADEGEPGTFKDRVLLQSHASRVLEGMALAAWVVGAQQGWVYLRAEYAYLLPGLRAELARMRQAGLLGTAILGVEGFDFDVDLHVGAGAYICGEETALLESLEGRPGRPRVRPPFPVTHGYRGQPTVVNNVETLCKALAIALHGGDHFAGLGTAQSTGTKLLSVSGDVGRPGVYEFPFGVSVAEVLAACGGTGAQAVQVSGPSGQCLAADEFERRLAFEDVPTSGAFMVFGPERDLFEVARNHAHFFAHESCGFCTPCRVGAPLQAQLMDKIAAGHGSPPDLQRLRQLADLLRGTAHCGLGTSACNTVQETLVKFRATYERRLLAHDFEPAFDLDGALSRARAVTGRDDAHAHLQNLWP